MADKNTKTLTHDMNENLSLMELKIGLRTALEKRAKLTFQHNVAPLKNPMELRHLRREIARIKTRISSQEAAT